MPKCINCEKDAVMFCANCGQPICATHTVEGRYCTRECYTMHAVSRGEGKVNHSKDVAKRSQTVLMLGVSALLLIAIVAIWLFWYGGF
ncbi:MAG: hypothetical protein KAW41_05920 [Candidatus Diapherotrites archaeon]|nr:hypothetical protein [Candidatus Diapherotrites archaeon]